MSPSRVILVRHDDEPPDDRVHGWLVAHGFEPCVVQPYRGDPLPTDTEGFVGSVVFGGPIPVFADEDHSFLRDEHRWIQTCLDRGVPLLGIRQGAQSIAHVLGAKVGPPDSGVHEFGCYEIRPTAQAGTFLEAPLHVVQNHFHAFDIPAGAKRLAESDLYPNQAFRVGECAYGVQFHPELTPEGFRRWQDAPDAAFGRPGAQTRAEQDRLVTAHDTAVATWLAGFLERLFGSGHGDSPGPSPS